ncbi:MAG TPA: TonB-dependent receptor [Rubricoccaceae bacterium]|nr:TonB-dependent receptor [Rubricoccaceae bacterium]
MSFRLLVGAAVLLTTTAASAQTLQGRLTDAESGQPLPGATVALPDLDTGTITDTAGVYQLNARTTGPVRVVFSYVGYRSETRRVTLGPVPVTLDVALSPTFFEAAPVTVTAKAQAADLLDTPQAVAVVDARAVERLAGASPLDALDEVAGVRLLRSGPAVGKPVIRGLTAQRVLVVADGIRQEGQQWGDEHGPEIGVADVHQIEVVRGPSSLLYGSDALGGVIQTTSENLFDVERPLEGTAGATGLSGARQGAGDLRLAGRRGRLYYEVRGGAQRSGQVGTPDGLIPNTAQGAWTGTLRLGHRVGRGTLLGEAGRYEARIGFFEPPEEGEEGSEPVDRFDIGEPYQRVTHDRTALRLNLPVAPGRLEVITALQQNRRREFGHDHGHGEEEEPEGEEHEDEGPALFLRLTTLTADARFHHRPRGRLFGTLGVHGFAQRNETLAEETLVPGARTIAGAVYVAETYALDRITLDAGLRFDVRRVSVEDTPPLGVAAQSRSHRALTGAVGLAWRPLETLSFAVNVGRAFRAPVLIELYGNGVHEGTLRFERGSPALRSEHSLTVDAVARWLTPHLYAEVSGFVNQIEHYIFPAPTGEVDTTSGFAIFDYTQANARLVGAEFRLDVHPHVFHGLGLHVSGDVTQGINRATDEPLPFVPPARVQAALEYRAETLGPARDVEARFGPTYTAAQDRPELPEEVPTEAYVVWDASLSAAFPLPSGVVLRPTFAIDNLFDEAYVDPLSRFRPYGILAPGRSVRLRLALDF